MQKIRISREQLSGFLKDPRAIKQFEQLFATVDAISVPIDDTVLTAALASTTANLALDTAQRAASDAQADLSSPPIDQAALTYQLAEVAAQASQAPLLDDANTVHRYGAEDVPGDKTFTGLLNVDEIRFMDGVTPASTLGTTYWDVDSQTLATIVDVTNSVTLQHGQEVMIRCVNKTGSIITDGQVVYINDAQGNRPTAALAKADNIATSLCIGVATQHIAINAEGFVTTIGLVHGYDTSLFTDGQKMYLSGTTAGLLTPTVPVSPGYLVMVATALNSTVNGSIFVHPDHPIALDGTMAANSDLVPPSQKAVKTYVGSAVTTAVGGAITKEFTGFTEPENVIVTYDSTTRKITLTGTVVAYWQGQVITALVSGWVSAAHTTTNGPWFLYYDGAAFVWATVPWSFDMLQIAYAYYGASDKFGVRETHGLMPWQVHEELHKTNGTYLEPISGGGDLGGYTPGSTTAAERRPSVSAATVRDEDLKTVIAALADNGPYTQMYLAGSAVNTFTLSAAEILPVTGATPYYNLNTAGTWSQAAVSAAKYTTVWLVAVPASADAASQAYRFIWIQGQSQGSLPDMQGTSFAGLNLGTLTTIFTEFVPLARIIVQNTGANWTLTQVDKLLGTRTAALSVSVSGLSTVAVTAPITGDGTVANPLAMAAATAAVNGYMTSTYATKVDGIAAGAQVNVLEGVTGTAPVVVGAVTAKSQAISMAAATDVVPGYLTAADHAAFAAKADLATTTAVASATLTAGQWVNFHNVAGVKNARPADMTDATKPAQGFVLAGFASSATATVYLAGANTVIPVGAYAAADVGKPVFLSTAGGTTLTPPATTGNLLQQVGWVDAVGATVTVNFTNSPGIVRA